MLILILSFHLIFSGCSNNPKILTETKYVKQYIPIELLTIECSEQPAGDTVRTLAYAYVKTRSCLRAHKSLIEGLKRNYTEDYKSDGVDAKHNYTEQGASQNDRGKSE